MKNRTVRVSVNINVPPNFDAEKLRKEAVRILVKNHLCNCKRCECESGRLEK